MYEFYNNILTLPANWLTEQIISYDNYKKLCARNVLHRVRDGKGAGNYALVEFDSIPERFRSQVVKQLGAPPKQAAEHRILQYYKTDYAAIDFFATYELEDGRNLSPAHQEEYTANAQMLNAVDLYMKEMAAFRKSRGGSITTIWRDAAEAVKAVKAQTGHKLPGTDRRLRDRMNDYKANSYKALISEKFQNSNADKVKDSQQEAALRQLLRDHRNLDNEQISTLYRSIASALGWPVISASTVANYRTKWDLLTTAGRHGEKNFDNYTGMQVKRFAPSYPLVYWTLDGWDAELLYQKTDSKGTTYHNRLTTVIVLDPCVKYPVGFAIGSHENTDLIKAALRNAVQHTEELFGEKHKVLQIQSDNYGKKTMMPIYEALSGTYTPAKVGNAKAKVIEPWFKWFNKTFCQLAPNWSGHGVKSKKQPNPEYLQKIRKSFPDEYGARLQLEHMIEMAREQKRKEYMEAYEAAPAETKRAITQKEFLMHFGDTTGYTNRLSHAGLIAAINGRKYSFDSFDLQFREYAHLDWTLRFDPDNLQQVLAVNEAEGRSFLLEQKHEQPMALYDRREGDSEQLQRIRQFNQDAKSVILDVQAEDHRTLHDLFNSTDKLDNTLAKMVLSDSRGQHKDRRNENRIAQATKNVQKIEQKEQKAMADSWDTSQDEYLKQKVNFDKYFEND